MRGKGVLRGTVGALTSTPQQYEQLQRRVYLMLCRNGSPQNKARTYQQNILKNKKKPGKRGLQPAEHHHTQKTLDTNNGRYQHASCSPYSRLQQRDGMMEHCLQAVSATGPFTSANGRASARRNSGHEYTTEHGYGRNV